MSELVDMRVGVVRHGGVAMWVRNYVVSETIVVEGDAVGHYVEKSCSGEQCCEPSWFNRMTHHHT